MLSPPYCRWPASCGRQGETAARGCRQGAWRQAAAQEEPRGTEPSMWSNRVWGCGRARPATQSRDGGPEQRSHGDGARLGARSNRGTGLRLGGADVAEPPQWSRTAEPQRWRGAGGAKQPQHGAAAGWVPRRKAAAAVQSSGAMAMARGWRCGVGAVWGFGQAGPATQRRDGGPKQRSHGNGAWRGARLSFFY